MPNSLSVRLKKCLFIFALISLMISIILNLLYGKQLFFLGINHIYKYQTKYESHLMTKIENIISMIGKTETIITILVAVHLLTYKKLSSIVYIFYITLNASLISIEKQIFL